MPSIAPRAPAVTLPAGFEQQLGDSHDRLCRELMHLAPDLCTTLLPWMRRRAAKGLSPTAYFTHPLAFPLLLLPWWLDESLGGDGPADLALHGDLLLSSMAGYYLVRLIDDVMDRSPEAAPQLLPAVAVLHAQFQSAYARWFPAEHPFWAHFHRAWARCNEAAVVEAGLQDIDEPAFQRASAPKVSAGVIPLWALAWQRNGGELPAAWAQLLPKLCAFHQRYNDLFDWKRDLDSGAATHFVCLGRRQMQPGESMFSWVAREGFAQEVQRLNAELLALQANAAHAGSPALCAWLLLRRNLLDSAAAQARAGFDAAAPLLRALQAQSLVATA